MSGASSTVIQWRGEIDGSNIVINGIRASYNNNSGIDPGIINMTTAMEDTRKIPDDGTFILGDGTRDNLTLTTCRVFNVNPSNVSRT